MTWRIVALGFAALLLVEPRVLANDPAHAPEPSGFWTGRMLGPVPATIAGGRVIHTAELKLLAAGGAIFLVDVSPSPHKPEGLAPNAVWMPPPHHDIPGSVWLPDVGRGAIEPAYDAWYRARLEGMTANDKTALIVVYCHPNCWASWNAAKRAILYGYQRVYWYPDGIEGWQDAGLATSVARPELPPS